MGQIVSAAAWTVGRVVKAAVYAVEILQQFFETFIERPTVRTITEMEPDLLAVEDPAATTKYATLDVSMDNIRIHMESIRKENPKAASEYEKIRQKHRQRAY